MQTMRSGHVAVPIEQIDVAAYTVPTDYPESDGTLQWDRTTLVLVEITAGDHRGCGYSYADQTTAQFITEHLAEIVRGRDILDVPASWLAMVHTIRNLGRSGITATAIAAVDAALWDVKARLLDLPLVAVLGQAHEEVPIYGSGGFTSYSVGKLQQQLSGWVDAGIPRVKMKIGRDPQHDPERVRAARTAIGPQAQLFVDSNGAYSRKQALALAEVFAGLNVCWFEEPVVASDLEGLRLICDRAPAGMDIAAGEYGYELLYFQRMLQAGAVDVLQADASRCGITGFLHAGVLCQAHQLQLSAHCAPALHVHPCCATMALRHLEYFHDHVRIEQMLFDDVIQPDAGALRPDLSRPGLGLEFKHRDAEPYLVWHS